MISVTQFPHQPMEAMIGSTHGHVGRINVIMRVKGLELRKRPTTTDCYPLQYSFLGNPMDRGAWWATVHGVAKSQTLGEKTVTSTRSSAHMQFVGSARRWQHCTLLTVSSLAGQWLSLSNSLGPHVTPWTAASQASLFFTISQSLL